MVDNRAKVAIIDYGMGNLYSVANAIVSLTYSVLITNNPEDLCVASHIILPGVGAFGDGMQNLKSKGWIEVLEDEVRSKGKPFLGLCLGMQLLATTGTEYGIHEGLNWIPGTVQRLQPGHSDLRVPHIGWNDAYVLKQDGLYAGLGNSQVFYFVHSYVLLPHDRNVVSATTDYGVDFVSSVEVGNIYATQFHPEKSQKAGLAVLSNFLKL